MAVVRVDGLIKRFGSLAAIDGVSFEMGEREFFSLVGPSGCGKTTTLRCVAGLESGDEGRIEIAGRPVFDAAQRTDVPPNERDIGMVFQSYAVWPHMTVAENIGYPLRVRGAGRERIATRVEEVLRILGMVGLGERRPSQLSGGQQQRVALGRALALNPSVLLLDEPLSNLDAKLREHMRAELKLIQREAGLPILYVTHDQVEALSMSDRIAVMHAGRIHHLAPPEEIYQRPATAFVLDFIGSVNYLPCTLVGEADGAVRLRAADGTEVTLPRPPHVPRGPEVLLAARPEDWRLLPPESTEGLPAQVVLRSFLGAGFEYHLRIGAAEIRIATSHEVSIPEGAAVRAAAVQGLLLEADARSRPDARAA